MAKTRKPYRKNAGIIVFNSRGLVLAGERIDSNGGYASWQLPQGGIDDHENPVQAARRELYEEMGLKLFEPACEIDEWFYYEFPKKVPKNLKKFRGQKQRWFLFFWDGKPEDLHLDTHDQEFRSVGWMEFKDLTAQIIEFKKKLYIELENVALPFIKKYLENRT